VQAAPGKAPQQEAAAPVVSVSEPAAAAAGADYGVASSSSSKGGWGVGGWGLGGLSSRLQQVALGAAKDLQELTASVQQVGRQHTVHNACMH
jgi:hypothetical protein